MATVKDFQSLRIAGKHASTPSRAVALYHEANSQTFKSGALLCLSSGLAAESTSGGADAEVLIGVATTAGQNVTTKPNCTVEPCLPGVVFEGILGNSADDLYTLTAADGDVGKLCTILKDAANGGWYLNATTAAASSSLAGALANARAKVVGYKDAAGTVNGRVYFVFLPLGMNNAGNAALRSTIYS